MTLTAVDKFKVSKIGRAVRKVQTKNQENVNQGSNNGNREEIRDKGAHTAKQNIISFC